MQFIPETWRYYGHDASGDENPDPNNIDDAALSDVVDEDWDPPVTRGARIVSILDDAAVHVGQAAYVLGTDASED